MAENIVVDVEPRTETGKNANRRLRREERIPGVVYGLGLPPFMVAVDAKRVDELLRLESGRNTIFTLSLVGKDDTRAVMIKDLQRDPATERLVHVDFIRLDLAKEIHVSVPIRLVDTPEGVKNEGGVLDFIHRQAEVACLPNNIPEHLDVDVSGLHINQHVSVGDIPASDDYKVVDEPETVIAVVVPPRAEAVPAAEEAVAEAEAEAEAEPEVIKKGKETEDEEAAAPKKSD